MLVKTLFYCVKKGMLVAVMVTTFMTLISFTSEVVTVESVNERVETISKTFPSIYDVMKVDEARISAIAKVYGFIDKYNPRMPPEEKQNIANEIYAMSQKYSNLDVDLICATISHESAFTWRKDVKSPAGAMGLMQIMPYTGYFLSKHEGIDWTTPEQVLYNPIQNIRMGCRYLSSLIAMYSLDGGLAAYNGGEWRAAKWLRSGRNNDVLFKETREYVPAVLNLYDSYRE